MKSLSIAALLLVASCSGKCTQPIDSTHRAPLGVLGLQSGWTSHTIFSGYNGADGTDLVVTGGGDVLVAVSWEQEGVVTLSTLSAGSWSTIDMGLSPGVEDSKIGDIDGQGTMDVVSITQSKNIKLHFGEVGPSDLQLTNPHNVQDWHAGALADMDGDGDLDIVAGGRRASFPAAEIDWFENPGGLDARSNGAPAGTFWPLHTIDVVGYAMNIYVGDVDGDADKDVVVSDRDVYHTGVGTTSNALIGPRWLENDGVGGWVRHQISNSRGGEPKMMSVVDFDGDGDLDVLTGSSNASNNFTYIYYNVGGFDNWVVSQVNQPSGVGQYHDAEAADIDGDGLKDIVFTYSDAYTAGLSGVIWDDQAGGWLRGEISGDDGDKWDNATLYDFDGDGDIDVMSTEQHETDPPSANPVGSTPGLGLVYYENPRLP